MDEAVRLALTKWPDVPSCTGWLRLSRRGEWWVPEGPIRHAGLRGFIGRNFLSTPDGRWYFQNGPQQVFVDLDYTPMVVRLITPDQLETHTGLPVTALDSAWLDEHGNLLLGSEHGIALLDDRDLAAMLDYLDGDLEAVGSAITLKWGTQRLSVGHILQADVPARFGFIDKPA